MRLNRSGVDYQGVVLGPKEYRTHEAHSPHLELSRPTLFVRDGGGAWSAVSPREANQYALKEATAAERRKLAQGGYDLM